jgi:hypothetical protein
VIKKLKAIRTLQYGITTQQKTYSYKAMEMDAILKYFSDSWLSTTELILWIMSFPMRICGSSLAGAVPDAGGDEVNETSK